MSMGNELGSTNGHVSNGTGGSTKSHSVRCGPARNILSENLQIWFRQSLGCVAGRREFLSNRYFAVDVQHLKDVTVGWHHFISALERGEVVACLYVIQNPTETLTASAECATLALGVRPAITNLAEIMSTLSDHTASTLVDGGLLNFVINLTCPVTRCRTAFFDFEAVAFVPEADNPRDPLYDPLMSAPVPIVNINSDIYAFSVFARDQCLNRFDCEVTQLTSRERRHLFALVSDTWQRMAERTINNYAAVVDQHLCPTHLTADKQWWIANHRDPAFAELEKRPFLHEMPTQYTRHIVSTWEQYFEHGVQPHYEGIAKPGEESRPRCPAGTNL